MRKNMNAILEGLNTIQEATFDVTCMRDGKEVTMNKKPLSKADAEEMAKDLKKATIPSVDPKSVKVVPVKESVNEAVSPIFNEALRTFCADFVMAYFKNMGTYPMEAMKSLENHLVSTVGQKILTLTANELQSTLEKNVSKNLGK